MVICASCRLRCHSGHRLQPAVGANEATFCDCGAGLGFATSVAGHGSERARCNALYESGAELEPPQRSVRVRAGYADSAVSGRQLFAGQVLDVVTEAPARDNVVAVRDVLVFDTPFYVSAETVTHMPKAFPSKNFILLQR